MKEFIWVPVKCNGVPTLVPLKYDEPVRIGRFHIPLRWCR